jgi:hypothetical protein
LNSIKAATNIQTTNLNSWHVRKNGDNKNWICTERKLFTQSNLILHQSSRLTKNRRRIINPIEICAIYRRPAHIKPCNTYPRQDKCNTWILRSQYRVQYYQATILHKYRSIWQLCGHVYLITCYIFSNSYKNQHSKAWISK